MGAGLPKSCLALAILIAIEVSFILLTSLELGLKFGGIEVRSKKKDDTSVQKYAGYLCNTHLSESEEVKDEWEGTAKGMYLRTWFGYTTKMWRYAK
jgi:hypothetical protein